MTRLRLFAAIAGVLVLSGFGLFAQPAAPPGEAGLAALLRDAERALKNENYENAIKLYLEAKRRFPDNLEAPQALGRLYSDKHLYDLALDEYLTLYDNRSTDYDIIYKVAETYGLLNRNSDSIDFFERGLRLFPGDLDYVQGLAWMYFKVEDYQKGIELLNETIRKHGTNRNYEMTLGTIYSNLFEYELSREHYLESIRLARNEGADFFSSIAYYNLSILEVAFYEYKRAREAVQASLDLAERPSGELALGELHQRQLNFRQALEAYEKADRTDETPLAKFNLAILYQKFGYFDLALAYTHKIETHKDESWMYNFGITKEKFRRDIHQLYHDIYEGQFHEADFDPRPWLWDWIPWLFKKAELALKAWYHGSRFKELQIALSEQSFSTQNNPLGWWSLYQAHRDYIPAARKYLQLSKDFETARTQKAEASYLLEEGMLFSDPERLAQALRKFDGEWEREEIAETLENLIPLLAGRESGQAEQLTAELYRLNPGTLRQHGLSLPIMANVYSADKEHAAKVTRQLLDFASSAGYKVHLSARPGVEYTLNLSVSQDGSYRFALRDKNGAAVFQDVQKPTPESPPTDFFRQLFDRIHHLPVN